MSLHRFADDPADLFAALAGLLDPRPAWHADAACREHPELTWFPERGQDVAAARAVCAGCLVRAECEAAGMGQGHGIWGGLTERERRARRRSAGGARQAMPPRQCACCSAEIGPRATWCNLCVTYRSRFGVLPSADVIEKRRQRTMAQAS